MTSKLELLSPPDLGQLFSPASGRMRACLHCSGFGGERLTAEPQPAKPQQAILLTIQSSTSGLLTIELSDDGAQWERAAWIAFKAGPQSALRFQASTPLWRPSAVPDQDTALVSVFAQSQAF